MINTEPTAGTSAPTMAALDHLAKQQKPYVLAINGGSSSINFALYQKGDPPTRQLHGKVDSTGSLGTTLTFDDLERNQHGSRIIDDFDHRSAATFLNSIPRLLSHG